MKRILAILMTLIMVFGLSSVGVWAADEPTWQIEKPMPTAKHSMTTSVVGDKAYVIGGSTDVILKKVEIFDPKSNLWLMGDAAMPTARYSLTSSVVGNKIYAIGGNLNGATNIMEIYDTDTGTWSTGASMPTKRSNLTSSVVGNKIYVIGGITSNATGVMEIYDVELGTWSRGSSMPTARYSLTSSVVGNKIYVIGGSVGGTTAIMEIYDTDTGTWSTGASMPTKRSDLTSSVVGNKIYVIGGLSNGIMEIYDTDTGTWSTGTPTLTQKVSSSSFVINNKIYILGGYGVGTNARYDRMESLQAGPIVTEPSQPLELIAISGESKVDLSWGAVTAATSYNVKRSTTTGGPYDVIASNITGTSYTDTDVTNGTTFYYIVAANTSAGESANSNEASATPRAGSGGEEPTTGKALLVITMTNGLEKEYELSAAGINAFISWYDGKATGSGAGFYKINKTFNLGPFLTRTDYLTFDKIQNFEVMQYQ